MENVKKNKEIVMSPSKMALQKLIKNKMAMLGLIAVVIVILFSFVGPLLMKFDMNTQTDCIQQGPMIEGHVLGTDKLGRDIMTRLMYGGRISILVGLVAVAIELCIGTFVGAISGYYGGKVDAILMTITEIWMTIPFLPVIIIMGTILSSLKVDPNVRVLFLILSMGILSWGGIARIVRGEILTLREQEFIQATEALGLRDRRKIMKHLIPNIIPILIVNATLDVGAFIAFEAALSYLGVGVSEPIASWGNMLQAANNQANLQKRAWLWLPPGICVLIISLGINLLGDGLRDALDPKKR
ncbi:oligopeptide ABC transporter permease [Clostridium butyricum]|uniref:Peptide ABC transporter permease n=1 Tax=Clostridium butyricum TaxID=1492 RepID=A0A2S7F6E0_CLOBU|nr:oligopeptide ABC transporter permease [Clostridium butyricum]KHD13621.1 peptide ABC transporter permease [Clostridium butyricum]NOW23971.1 peptide/nickel transport system permease protein [Clostridium butyricum]PPV12454.1 peptide ABC transporter permease [Clostridium butyricum]PPV13335.1 peptide ABC transporter permease [Clostridium butyricum]GEQ23169.1 peptide ABC transporter permease [Clostridium butyricum]